MFWRIVGCAGTAAALVGGCSDSSTGGDSSGATSGSAGRSAGTAAGAPAGGGGRGGTSGASGASGASPGAGGVLAQAGGSGAPTNGGRAGAPPHGAAAAAVSGGSGSSAGGSGSEAGAPGQDDDEILAPAKGALIGQYYGDGSIEATKQKLGRMLPVHLTYYAWSDDWTAGETKADLKNDRIPFVNWELYDGGELDQIIDGTFDSMLRQRATAAKALGKKLFLDLGAEMNGDWSPWSGAQNGKSADKYVAMYRHVHDELADADNIVWVWCPNVTDEPNEAWNAAMAYYPGDDYVDWTCVDGYNWGSSNGGGWQSFKSVFKTIYPKLASKNKPIMIGEMASAEVGGDKADWIAQIIPVLQNDYPLIKGLIWFDVDKETDWRISSSPDAEAAFKAMVNDPYFKP